MQNNKSIIVVALAIASTLTAALMASCVKFVSMILIPLSYVFIAALLD